MYEQDVIDALARLRDLGNLSLDEREAFQALDDAGVFAAIDEQAQTGQAEEILQGGRALDPSVWGGETPKVGKCNSCGLRTADGSEYHESCRPARNEKNDYSVTVDIEEAREEEPDFRTQARAMRHLGLAIEHYRHDA